MSFTQIDIKNYQGTIPADCDLVIVEKEYADAGNVEDHATILYGFDEEGVHDHKYRNPVYGFLKNKR